MFSTDSKKGHGPEDYYSCIGFDIMQNGDIEILDALRYKLKRYSNKMEFIENINIPKDVLPVIGYKRLSNDEILFEDRNKFKLYSCLQKKILKNISISNHNYKIPRIRHTAGIQTLKNNLYYSPLYPDANLYVYNKLKQKMEPYISFQFPGHDWNQSMIKGQKSNLNNYFFEHPEYVFVADKIRFIRHFE